jgi:hypothetical protein
VALLAYAAAQLGTLIAIAPRVSAWLRRPRLWRVVNACNKEVMTVYLWQMFPVVAGGVLLYPTGAMPQPTPGTTEWWLLRPLWMINLTAFMVPLILATRRLRRPQRRPTSTIAASSPLRSTPSTPARPATADGTPALLLAAVALTSFALARFAINGFAPNGRLPIETIAAYSAGLLLIAANSLLSRRRLGPALASAAPRPVMPTRPRP